MPRQKRKQPSPTAALPLLAPGFRGLNTELSTQAGSADPTWATVLENAVYDNAGRVTIRPGFTIETTTPITSAPTVLYLHEYRQNDGTKSLIAWTSLFSMWESTDDGATWSDITGAISSTRDDWMILNFNGNCYATGPGHKVWEYTGTGTFTQVANSNVTRGVLLAAYGRLWAARDASTAIDYSVLLDGGDWASAGSGSIDTANVWTQGFDVVRSMAAFGSTFVVFGREHILMYVDGTGSVLGIDPDNMYVVDTIEGTGCEFRDSVVNIGEGDLWFISAQGLQSLARVVQDKSNPLADLSKNVRSLFRDRITGQIGESTSVQAAFSPENQYVIFTFSGDNEIVMFDTRLQMEDGTYRASNWTDGLMANVRAVTVRENGDIFYGLTGGEVGKVANWRDDSGGGSETLYSLKFATPWVDGGPDLHNRLKMPKNFYGFFYGRETLTATARWSFDFRPLEFSDTFTNEYLSSGGEWGSGEFNEDEFGTGHRLRRQYVPSMGDGFVFKLYLDIQSTDIDTLVAIQEVGVLTRIGRVV